MRPTIIVSLLACGVSATAAEALEPYVTAQIGIANIEWPRGTPLNGRIDDRDIGLGVDFGLAFSNRWGVEFGAYHYGGLDARGVPCTPGGSCAPVVTDVGGADITILKAALAPRFEIGRVRLFVPFGYYRARIDTNLALPEARSHDSGVLLGLGARWYFADPWNITVQATRFDDNLSQVSFGVGWGLRDRRDRDRSEERSPAR